MRRLVVPLALGLLVVGCGGGHPRHAVRSAPPVAQQVRAALLSVPVPRLPYSDVKACTGPAGGGAGTYHCITVPRGSRGVRSLDVDVSANGQWSTRPIAVAAKPRSHRSAGVTSLWGVGIQLPR